MTAKLTGTALMGGILLAALANCGTGGIAEAVRPQAKTAAQVMGGDDECRDVKSGAKPLVVDWSPEKRADLEVAMREGVAIVSYDCKKLDLLTDCKADGSYGFKAVILKQQLIRLEDSNEIKANLPLSGAALVAKLSAELERGATLDLATALVGKRMSTRVSVPRGELKGRCDGATHFLRGAGVGAFVMQTGEKARVATAVEVFSAGAGAKSTSNKMSRQEDGSVDACKKAVAEQETPPPGCGGLIRLELLPISEGAATKTAVADDEGQSCAAGLVYANGKCTKLTSTATHTCAPDDVPDCTAQCDKNDAASCGRLANTVLKGGDAAKATSLFEKACGLEHGSSCSNLGALQLKKSDAANASKSFEKGCALGAAVGCFNLGNLYYEGVGVTKDLARAASLYQQACNAGSADGCVNLGNAYDDGEGVTKDSARALKLFKRACEGDHGVGCTNLGAMYAAGTGIAADVPLALKTWDKGCTLGSGAACEYLGKRYKAGDGVTADPAKGASYLTQACKLGVKTACP
ncbi:MAG: sel1 repeat family protein [Deltaproteobacteria bacterium]|nr:sel1 repeat family protein [Deltaproteobacteria bacterium]